MAGVAIILMLTLHFFSLDSVRLAGMIVLSINDIDSVGNFRIVRLLEEFGNMCVAMFAVSSGMLYGNCSINTTRMPKSFLVL